MSNIIFSTNRPWQNWQTDTGITEADEKLHSSVKEYGMPFAEKQLTSEEFARLSEWALNLKATGVETLIVAGIGGSTLGARAIRSVFSRYSDSVIFWEGPHPQKLMRIGKIAENEKTALLFISKSGTTLESRTNLAIFRQFFPEVPEYFITESPENIADLSPVKENIFSFPAAIDGRYSVISAAGILPGLFMGADMDGFLNGYREGHSAWDVSVPYDENGAKIAALQYYNLIRAGFDSFTFWTYARDLRAWSDWLIQLWAESLGKEGRVRALPVATKGPEDQHSLLQYFTDGPNHTAHTFFHTESYGVHDTVVPDDIPVASAGSSLWQVLQNQMKSTERQLSENKRPVSEFMLPALDMTQLGKLMTFWMYTVTYTGFLLDINPYTQPGIEKGKKMSNDSMSRGSEDSLNTITEI